jgi:cutinase
MGFIPVVQAVIPDLAVQGLNYPAGLMSYTKPNGVDPKDVATALSIINTAVSKCPASNILLSGWSLGTAVIRGALKQLPADVIDKRLAAVLLFGDTQYKQTNHSIPGLAAEKWKIYCSKNDGTCGGQITLNGEHISYQGDAGAGAQWLAERVKAFKAPKTRRSVDFRA